MFFAQCEQLKNTSFWIFSNLGAPDGLIYLFGISINVLPILMTLINLLSAEIYSKDKPVFDKIQMYSFALIFLILLYHSPSGLVIYWTLNNIFSLIKNIGLNSKNPVKFLKYVILAVLGIVVFPVFYSYFKYPLLKYGKDICSKLVVFFILLFCGNFIFKKYYKQISSFLSQNPDRKLFWLLVMTICIWTGFLIPSTVISSSVRAFCFLKNFSTPFFIIFDGLSQIFGIFVFWPCILYYFFNTKIKNCLTIIFSSALIFIIYQTLVFKVDNTLMSFDFTFNINNFHGHYILNCLLILLITAFSLCLYSFKKTDLMKKLTISLLSASVLFCMYNSVKIFKTYLEIKSEAVLSRNIMNKKPIKLSKKGKNVLIIFIDRATGIIAQKIFEENSKLAKDFSGFVLYPNSATFYIGTVFSYPPMVGGYEYTPENFDKRKNFFLQDMYEEALLVLPVLFRNNDYNPIIINPVRMGTRAKNLGYIYEKANIDIYDYPIDIENFFSNYSERGKTVYKELDKASAERIKKNLIVYIFSVILPDNLKIGFYKSMEDKNKKPWDKYLLKEYVKLSALPDLTEIKPNVKGKGTFTFINNELTHINKYNQNYWEEHIYIQNEGFYTLKEYFEFLKKNDVFDNTRIILVSDHGTWGEHHANFNPLIMVKDFEDKKPFRINFKFMTNADVPFLALSGIVKNPVNPITNNVMKQEKDHLFIPKWTNKNFFKENPENIINPGDTVYSVTGNVFDDKYFKEIIWK